MNLTLVHFAKTLIGGIVGASILFALSYLIPLGSFPDFERVLTLQQMGLIFGWLGGMATSILILVVKDSHQPETGSASNFTSINGTGSRFFGKSDMREDESYLCTEWFCMLWIPFFPVCTYRVIQSKELSTLFTRRYTILEKHPVRMVNLVEGYLQTILFVLAIDSAVWFLRWIET